MRVFCIIVCVLLPVFLAAGEFREFKSADGQTIKAEIVEATDSVVTIRNAQGRVFRDVSLERFSAADRSYIRDWLKQQVQMRENADISRGSRVRITFVKGKDDDFNDYGDIDDRVVRFEPGVIIESQEHEIKYPGVSGTVVVVGKGHLNSKEYVILDRQDFNLDVLPRERSRWTGKGFQCIYDPDYGGFEYGGYLLVLRNREGRIVMAKASKSSWERAPQAILKAKERTGYNSDFTRSHELFNSYGLPGYKRY